MASPPSVDPPRRNSGNFTDLDQSEWTDIRGILQDATSELGVGELIMATNFDLFDCMSALEIMDPKMDSGLKAGEEVLASDYRCDVPLSAAQTLWVIDQLLVHEMTWHSGQSILQTLFTCVYHRYSTQFNRETLLELITESPLHFVLITHIVATFKCVHVVSEQMQLGQLYENEDFTSTCYGRRVSADLSILDALQALEQSHSWLQEKGQCDSTETDSGVWQALLNRTSFRIEFLGVLSLHPFEQRSCDTVAETLDRALALLNSAQSFEFTHSLGDPSPRAFSKNNSRLFNSQLPPRAIKLFTIPETVDYLCHLLQSLRRTTCLKSIPSPTALLYFLQYFQNGTVSAPPFARATLLSMLDTNEHLLTRESHHQFVVNSIRDFSCPPPQVLPPDSEFAVILAASRLPPQSPYATSLTIPLTHQVVRYSTPAFVSLMKLYGQNRARQRRLLRQLLDYWDDVYRQIATLDSPDSSRGSPRFSPITAWAINIKLDLMTQFLASGFSLDLYAPWEYTLIYWYLDYLFSHKLSHVEAMHRQMTQYFTSPAGTSEVSSRQRSYTLASLQLQCQEAFVKRRFSRGQVFLLAALIRLNRHPSCTYGFSNGPAYFSTRFRLFLRHTMPTMLAHQDWEAMESHLDKRPVSQLLRKAQQYFTISQQRALEIVEQISRKDWPTMCLDDSLAQHLTQLAESAEANQTLAASLLSTLESPEGSSASPPNIERHSLPYSADYIIFRTVQP
ncbi:N-alpha-acetyltransferase, non-catalitic subunit [Dispira parvispora]|uniref:N-alpha-acetyltransferase, non-catalitic subunit n=1 Tax=Dispira parvispora TaxID=1520584 RepID=A0A9W8AR99_9FUNG|nr:N-alpha-acetyltransferase, non-catalitic subunit [Dispira parvispora]